MTTSADRQPLIGPHEGRELELMLEGEKPLALFFAPIFEEDILPIDKFASYVENGTFIGFDQVFRSSAEKTPGLEIRLLLYALPDEAWRIEKAKDIILPIISGDRTPSIEDDTKLGQLLGYSREAITAFTGHANAT